MTEPTDAEIRDAWEQYNPMHGIESFARAVLAKWVQPDQKTVTVVPATGDVWLKHDDDLRYVRRVLEAGRQMTDVDQRAAIDIVQGPRITARSMAVDAKKPAQAAEPVATQWLAEMIMSDCGCSTENQRLLDRIIERIQQYERANAAPQPVAREPLSDEQIEALPMWKRFVGLWPETRREIVRIIEAQHGIKGGQHGTA